MRIQRTFRSHALYDNIIRQSRRNIGLHILGRAGETSASTSVYLIIKHSVKIRTSSIGELQFANTYTYTLLIPARVSLSLVIYNFSFNTK